MPHVITQPCCADASCVVACPVNCIHPAPGEPGFAEAEMLYVDPDTCVDCGACVSACPVGAIKPHAALAPDEAPFLALNAGYYDAFPHADRTPVAVVPPQRRLTRPGPFRVAVVGAGPAGLYTADELLRHPEIAVDVYDRLPTPYGLVRAGVAPDHHRTRRVTDLFAAIEGQPGFRYFLGVEVGRDLDHDWLRSRYDAVVHASGASADRALGIPGEELAGSIAATDLVGWYNAHPDRASLDVPLDHERAVVVGNGNVALDVARILASPPERLERSDVSPAAWPVLRASRVREVVVLGRRGPAQAAFTLPELIGLVGLPDVDVVVDLGGTQPPAGAAGRLLRDVARRPHRPGARRIVLRFCTAPVRIVGTDRVDGLEVVRTRLVGSDAQVLAEPTGETETIRAGLVVRSVGYRALPVPGLPFDEASGTVPHDRGRVAPGSHVVGWLKRGPRGFIGTNKSCAQETVARILDDLDSGALPRPQGTLAEIRDEVLALQPRVVDLAGWRAIDREERRRGSPSGRPRLRMLDVEEMVAVAHEGSRRSRRPRRYPARRPGTRTGELETRR